MGFVTIPGQRKVTFIAPSSSFPTPAAQAGTRSPPSLPPPDEGSGVVPAVSSRGAAAGMSQSPGGGGAALKNNDCNYAYLNQDIKTSRDGGKRGLSGFNLSFLSPSLARQAAFQKPGCCSLPLPAQPVTAAMWFASSTRVVWSLRDTDTQVGRTHRSFLWHLQLLSQPICPGTVLRAFQAHPVPKHPCAVGLCACAWGQCFPTWHLSWGCAVQHLYKTLLQP